MPKKHTISTKTRKRPGKDLDEIREIMDRPEKLAKMQNQPRDEDLPGAGQSYCVECDRHFVNDRVREKHKKTKVHKQQVKRLEEEQTRRYELADEGPDNEDDDEECNEDGIPYGIPSGCGSCVRIGSRIVLFKVKPVEGVHYVLKK
ncbi:hypothetical protein ACQ4LE_001060 [Meloidogyne hapla]|uniref:C2H2-type domain-containing protein n=1 Tax=Meloidogyne hapla TaxID=6305 RepID=A0A1I8BE65_MELHA